jgi:predicted oxidoreductase (fatty acid repression mutant protein)
MAKVVTWTGMEHKSQRIDVVAVAAEKHLSVWDFTAEELQGVLNDSVPSSQTAGLV